jgi:hypothetical protein
LLELVYEAFFEFRGELDDRWYYTETNFRRMNKSFDDTAAELGFPIDHLGKSGQFSEADRWRALRLTQTVGCQINDTFWRYLHRRIEGPDEE